MKVLVTGGAGFIGSHIVDKLIDQGHDVAVIDDLSTGKESNLNHNARFYNVSITDKKIEGIFSKEQPDFVIHQAAQVDVTKSIKDPIKDAEINIIGSLKMLELCRKYNVKKIVYGNSGGAGSGEPKYLPVDEKHPIDPLSPYGVSKHTVEHYLKIYSKIHGLRFTSLRYANVYGPRQDPFGEGGVVAIFTHKLLQDKAPKIFGDGEQTRDFIFVEDVADANIAALTKADQEIINIGTSKDISVNQLFDKLKKITDKDIKAIYVSPREGEIVKSSLTKDKMIDKLDINITPIEEGLKDTVKFFKNQND